MNYYQFVIHGVYIHIYIQCIYKSIILLMVSFEQAEAHIVQDAVISAELFYVFAKGNRYNPIVHANVVHSKSTII